MITYLKLLTKFNIYLKNNLTTTTYQNINVNINHLIQLLDTILVQKKNIVDYQIQTRLINLLLNTVVSSNKTIQLNNHTHILNAEILNLNMPLYIHAQKELLIYKKQTIPSKTFIIQNSISYKSILLLILFQLWIVLECKYKSHFQLNKRHIYTVLKSPHTDKKSRMQFAKITKKSVFNKLDQTILKLIKPIVETTTGTQIKTTRYTKY